MAQKSDEYIGPMPGGDAADLLASGAALIRIENDTQMQIAIQRPRDEAKILAASLKELETYPSAAEKAIYHKPVGRMEECPACGAKTNYKERCPKCGAEVPQKYAEGLSINAAQNLANRWANSAWAAQIIGDDGKTVSGVAIFMDYEHNTRRAVPFRVSRLQRRRDGATYMIQEDRFHDLVVRAATSKALREVIVRSLPAGLKTEYEIKAREVFAVNAKKPEAIKRMLQAFATQGVSAETLEAHFAKPVGTFTVDDMRAARGMLNAIQDGEMTVATAFGGGEDAKDSGASLGERLKERKSETKTSPPAADAPLVEESAGVHDIQPDESPEAPISPDDALRADLWTMLMDQSRGSADQAKRKLRHLAGVSDVVALSGKALGDALNAAAANRPVKPETKSASEGGLFG